MTTPAGDSPNVRFPPPTLFILGFIAGYSLHRWLGHDEIPAGLGPSLWLVGALAIAGGVSLIAWAVVTFRRFRTTLLPMRPSAAMVADGPYRFTRNPMYIGLTSIYTGASLMAGYAWPLACLPLVLVAVKRLIVGPEERYLERRFGDTYRTYKNRVRRWV